MCCQFRFGNWGSGRAACKVLGGGTSHAHDAVGDSVIAGFVLIQRPPSHPWSTSSREFARFCRTGPAVSSISCPAAAPTKLTDEIFSDKPADPFGVWHIIVPGLSIGR